MKNTLVAPRSILAAAAAMLLVLSLGGCQCTDRGRPVSPSNPGPHSHAEGKDGLTPVGNPGPHS